MGRSLNVCHYLSGLRLRTVNRLTFQLLQLLCRRKGDIYSFAFMAKWGFFGPSSVKRGRTHIVLGWNMSGASTSPLHTLKIWGAGVYSPRSYGAELELTETPKSCTLISGFLTSTQRVPHFYRLHFCPSISSPAFSSPATLSVIFLSCKFSAPALDLYNEWSRSATRRKYN